jgi:S-adenosyl-L-methionine hydrolase (adenosine-forming)
MSQLITLLTDFGTSDSYVAEVKGVLLSLAPGAQLVDISHDIEPGDIRAAFFVLSRAWPRFPAGTVHLVVVDPGVGTARRALAAQAAGQHFVAPDNGLLTSLPADARFVSLPIPTGAAPTFHARDVFAPAAAALASGAALATLGSPVSDPIETLIPSPRLEGSSIVGEVIHVDRFGTLITNLQPESMSANARLVIAGGRVATWGRTFADVRRGKLVALVGSGGTIEIAARDASAAMMTQQGVGAAVRIEPA